jgi:hypothetical protein
VRPKLVYPSLCRRSSYSPCSLARRFLRQQAAGILACDFLTVDSGWLAGVCVVLHRTGHPTGPPGRRHHQPERRLGTQQARNLLLVLGEQGRRMQYVLRDRDAKFCRAFDDLFRAEGAEVVLTPRPGAQRQCLRGALGRHGPRRAGARVRGTGSSCQSQWG